MSIEGQSNSQFHVYDRTPGESSWANAVRLTNQPVYLHLCGLDAARGRQQSFEPSQMPTHIAMGRRCEHFHGGRKIKRVGDGAEFTILSITAHSHPGPMGSVTMYLQAPADVIDVVQN
jgi:hypothetical protein